MTLLVTSIMPTNLAELSNAAQRAWEGRTDAVEVRIDRFEDDLHLLARYLCEQVDRTWIVTCRSSTEGGHASGGPSERAERLVAATAGTNVFVDFEAAAWAELSAATRKQLQASSMPDFQRLILSAHDFTGQSLDVGGQLSAVDALPDLGCSKLAYVASHITDSFAALDGIHDSDRPVTIMAMGEAGLWTRVLARKLGAFAGYCTLDANKATAPGQLTLDEMVNRYRWHELTESTRVFGVIGEPVGHSMGPLLFNRWFADAGVDAVYLPLLVGRDREGLRRFLDGCRKRPWLDIGGFSVTIPHKTAALDWVGPGADARANGIGALNTISFQDGHVTGYNTDCSAAISSMVDALRCERCDLAGVSVDVLGTGGAARAIMYGLNEVGCDVTIFGRSDEKAKALGDSYNAKSTPWNKRTERRGDVLINCTNVGMWPAVDESPMPSDSLDGCRLVFDLVYHPLETRLLKHAQAGKIPVLSGLDMFLRQASQQFELWTGKQPDTTVGRELVTRELQNRTGHSS